MIIAKFMIVGSSLVGFKVSGHADYGEYGQDIVCASVSSAVQLVCNTITECFNVNADVSVGENGTIALELLPPKDSPATTLIEGLKLHLELLSEEFPNTINIRVVPKF